MIKFLVSLIEIDTKILLLTVKLKQIIMLFVINFIHLLTANALQSQKFDTMLILTDHPNKWF